MAESTHDNIAKISRLEVLFYLLLIPLSFTYAVHFIDSKNAEVSSYKEAILSLDSTKLNTYATDFRVFRELLPFYKQDNKYTKTSDTNEGFNYTIPILGTREMKIIKAKEEMKYIAQGEKVQTVV